MGTLGSLNQMTQQPDWTVGISWVFQTLQWNSLQPEREGVACFPGASLEPGLGPSGLEVP